MFNKLMKNPMLIAILVTIVILIIAFYLTYQSGKKGADASNIKPPKKITGDLPNERIVYLTGLANNLYNDMEGANWNWDFNLYRDVSLLNDTEIVVLSNIFNNAYQKESGETFYQWLDSQYFSFDSFELDNLVDTVKLRLTKLGVS